MILMIDNYDSFTYNLVQYIGQLGEDVVVHRNDEISIDEIRELKPDAIFLSPGPCTPKEAGISVDVVRQFNKTIPTFGVCLGHQAIAYAFGADVVRAQRIMHGKTSEIITDGRTIFKGLPNPLIGGPLPFPDLEERFPSHLLGDQRRNGRRGNYGCQAQGVSRGGRAVSPRIGAHTKRKADPEEFLRDDPWEIRSAHFRSGGRSLSNDQGSD